MNCILILRTILLIFLLLGCFYLTGKVNKMLDDSFQIKENLDHFEEIRPKLESCWTQLRKFHLWLGCLSTDEKSFGEIAYFLTSCFLEKNDLPGIDCFPPSPSNCGKLHSENFRKQFGFNLIEVILDGIKHKYCEGTTPLDEEEIWSNGVKWEQIMKHFLEQYPERKNTLGLSNSMTSKQKIRLLKELVRNLVHKETLKTPFTLQTQPKSIKTESLETSKIEI